MPTLAPRPSLPAAVLCLCLCLRLAGAGPRPAAPGGAAVPARGASHCYATPRLDDAGPSGPAPAVADVGRHHVVRHRSVARVYSGCGLALLAPPIRRFRGIDGGAYAARVAYYRVDAGGCRRPVALRWYGGCRGGAAPSPDTCGGYSHTYQGGSPPTAHALVNASLLAPVAGPRAAAYDYEILVGDRLHVGRLSVAVAAGPGVGPRSPPGPASSPPSARAAGAPGAPCRPVAPAAPLWRSVPAAWVSAANPLFDGPAARRCVPSLAPAEPRDLAYVSAAPQSLLVGLAGYMFTRLAPVLEGGDPALAAPTPEDETPAPRARPARMRVARGLLSVPEGAEEAEGGSAPSATPAPAGATSAGENGAEGASEATPSAPAPATTPPASPAPATPAANGTGGAVTSPAPREDATPAIPTAGTSGAGTAAAGDDGVGVSEPTSAAPETPRVAEEASSAPPPVPEGTGGNATAEAAPEAGGSEPPPSSNAATPGPEAPTPPPEGEGAAEREGAEREDADDEDDDDDEEEGAGDGEPPSVEDPSPAADATPPGPKPGTGDGPYPPPPRRPAVTLPPPHLGPLTLRPPSPPTEPAPPSAPPAEPPHRPLFPFLTASPGLDFIFLLSLAAHGLAFVIITVMVLRPCRPRDRGPSRSRVRYTRLAASEA
uniref:Glycoprotein G n=1 Tax=Cercopithecine herpesvirus 16 TaxID=340907 RepID=Q5EGX8_CHV16|nr:glycoprotein G [Papiine alphaherpesvirus 2]UYB79335.1 envelope glycoprotein G [synthetic construct]UYB79408.1 envelope glycoprotein G [synthetic construct]UYB79482.1 envelope glycoprotein G [Papiine alphaherpesvirus 2]